jgi:hypothetical protein
MQFRTRSIGRVLTDLTIKLEQLPLTHPERPALIRMILGLKAELATRRGQEVSKALEALVRTAARAFEIPRWPNSVAAMSNC